MMRDPIISLCMIVKNEEAYLPKCLSSVKQAVDEIIIVDTGSADHTVEIANQMGAKVIQSEWRNDFAYARNVGLEQVKGKWILFLDADEQLDPLDKEKLRECAMRDDVEAYNMQIHNLMDDGQVSIVPTVRMFRNRPGYRFKGRIHEQILFDTSRPERIIVTDIKILHSGYLKDHVATKNKMNRNLSLLLEAFHDDPDNYYILFNLGVENMRSGNLEKAVELFQKSRALAPPGFYILFNYESRCLQGLGRFEESVQVCDEGIKRFFDYTDLYHLKAIGLVVLNRIDEAKAALHRAWQIGKTPLYYATEEGVGTYRTCWLLGELYEAGKEYRTAIEWYLKAVKLNSGLIHPFYRLFRLLRCTETDAAIVSFTKKGFDDENQTSVRELIQILINTQCFEAALAMLDQWSDRLNDQYVQKMKNEVQLLSGNAAATNMDEAFLKKLLCLPLYQLKIENMEFAVKTAYAAGDAVTLSRILEWWQNQLNDPYPSIRPYADQRLVKTLCLLVDKHLEQLALIPAFSDQIREIRINLPFEDGI